ncbi:hypothetical protein CASFOL_019384 [Castilleja foliolosa]|uniref:RING-type E3 ubiquitin transferase n=1 Tax=Castilleja foliolosa TaxID=1961234 RepID=A0ABD3D483_9LAMI
MSQECPRPLLSGGDVGPTRTSISNFFSNPFTRSTPANPDNYFSDGEEDDEIAATEDPVAGDCGYSRPFLFLDMIWNLAFVLVSVFVLLATITERPSTPLRLWVFGYALQCLLHVGFVWDEYQRRSLDDDDDNGARRSFHLRRFSTFSALTHKSTIKKLESVNTIVSSVWWVFGFYWIVIGGQPLLQDSPRLYWLSVVFLAFDVFFMVFCIAMACIVFFLLFCCFPILATVAYAMTIRDGASENDIRSLPKYIYRQKNSLGSFEDESNLKSMPGNSFTSELFLNPEDSECCICLYKYVDGTELCTLPCNHHFHHRCVTKWLRINATCPLCKFNILRGDMLV